MPNLFGQPFSRYELARRVGDFSQVFGVELLAYEDGRERALRVLRFRTGSGLSFDVLVDRAMDVAGMTYRGVPIGWHSPAGFRHPWLHEVDAEDGLGWMRSFSGMMNTCGLDHIMAAAEDTAEHYCYPDRKRVFHGLHGRISYEPARLTGYGERWDGDRCFLYAEGEIRQAAMYAENLILERRIEVEVGTDTVRIRDRVRNAGFYATPHLLLYHVNIGWPVVDETTRLVAPIEATPFTAHDPAATRIRPHRTGRAAEAFLSAGLRAPRHGRTGRHRARRPGQRRLRDAGRRTRYRPGDRLGPAHHARLVPVAEPPGGKLRGRHGAGNCPRR